MLQIIIGTNGVFQLLVVPQNKRKSNKVITDVSNFNFMM
jgi:hypothetical protein